MNIEEYKKIEAPIVNDMKQALELNLKHAINITEVFRLQQVELTLFPHLLTGLQTAKFDWVSSLIDGLPLRSSHCPYCIMFKSACKNCPYRCYLDSSPYSRIMENIDVMKKLRFESLPFKEVSPDVFKTYSKNTAYATDKVIKDIQMISSRLLQGNTVDQLMRFKVSYIKMILESLPLSVHFTYDGLLNIAKQGRYPMGMPMIDREYVHTMKIKVLRREVLKNLEDYWPVEARFYDFVNSI